VQSPSLPGQLELLKLSFFPAVFVAAPGLGIIDSMLDGTGDPAVAAPRGDDWAVEYAGMVRNML
jgi:hypothetical protein